MNGEGASNQLVVIDSIAPAIGRTKAMLFGPILLGMWLRFGLLAFVEELPRVGGSPQSDFGIVSPPPLPTRSWNSLGELMEVALAFWEANALTIMAIALLGLLIVVPVRYLACRAEVMFVRGCAAGATSLSLDWSDTRAAGHSLFRFHLILLALGVVLMFSTGAILYVAAIVRHDLDVALPWMIAFGVLVVASSVVLLLAESLTRQFVSPIMVCHDLDWREAWSRVGPVLLTNWAPLIGYYLLKILFWMLTSVAALLAGCATLCIGFLPVIQQTLLAPLHVFERNWSMVMLHYLGPGFEVFHETEPAPEALSDAPWAPRRDETP